MRATYFAKTRTECACRPPKSHWISVESNSKPTAKTKVEYRCPDSKDAKAPEGYKHTTSNLSWSYIKPNVTQVIQGEIVLDMTKK